MKARISPRTRQRAALLCQVAASNVGTENYLDVHLCAQPKSDARSLALEAYIASSSRYTSCIDGDAYVKLKNFGARQPVDVVALNEIIDEVRRG